MTPIFPSWAAFFAMGGYAFYVWLAVVVTFCALLALIGHTLWQRHALLAAVRRDRARAQRMRQGAQRSAVLNAAATTPEGIE